MERRDRRWDVLLGMLLLLACHLTFYGLLWIVILISNQLFGNSVLQPIAASLIILIGLTQLMYVIPLCLQLKKRGRTELAKGVVNMAVVTFLLNGSCFAVGLYILSTL